MKDYHIHVFYSEDQGCYGADIPDLEGCRGEGVTGIVALRQVLLAKQEWINNAKMSGLEIPEPNYRPVIYQVAH